MIAATKKPTTVAQYLSGFDSRVILPPPNLFAPKRFWKTIFPAPQKKTSP